MEHLGYLKSINAAYIDELYENYLKEPESVDSSWRYFFEGIEFGLQRETGWGDFGGEAKVAELINAYRDLGRLVADLDPLAPLERAHHPLLELSRFGLSEADLSKTFTAARLIGMERAPLAEIIARLREIYCGSIGIEFTHIHDPQERQWVQDQLEQKRLGQELDVESRKFILKRLSESELFERFLHTRYVAQKRFSIEGGESAIPALDCMIEEATRQGAEQIVIGMAHRGRLNVLANIFGKKPEYIFTEFEGNYTLDTSAGEGDVKYHLGYSHDFTTRQGHSVHLALASNPSHLEFINPVIEGMVRAKQDFMGDTERMRVLAIAIHGDAAFAGQGVCYETLNLARLEGYGTGGTLHLVINNQIGFTANPEETRSTTYATDLAKMLEVPILHVNGDDPEAVWAVSRLATEYRQKFHKDVFIDLLCYRRHGHNEGDEPAFTQPLLYSKIRSHPTTRERYARRLMEAGVVTDSEVLSLNDGIMGLFGAAQAIARKDAPHPPPSTFENRWKGLRAPSQREGDPEMLKPVETGVSAKKLLAFAEKLNRMPGDFHLHPKLVRFFATRLKAVQEGTGIDWGNAETLAYASLLMEGTAVRLSGQDAERGTFTHRHSVLKDVETGVAHTPLNHLASDQARFEVYNSHLSETAVLGFEYGYTLTDPRRLVIWEAQFGDFSNGAQVIIDQFISSSESKWARSTGVVLLLPHGMEGQGPEHSSARLERFLQLSARNNWAICNLTTPAQIFHALRRQMKREFRKPLVVMSPKSLLRNPRAVSALSDLSDGKFTEVLDDPEFMPASKAREVRKVLFCSGKVFYDLLIERSARGLTDVAVIRVEQLYPWPRQMIGQVLKKYSGAKEWIWAQEEPRNMGAWSYVSGLIEGEIPKLRYAGRESGAAPAVGSAKIHEREQKALMEAALGSARKMERER